jgi:glycosyltransferase involved in cell wall biosynthesis
MEAISCGLPVIATCVGGNPEIVIKSNGIIIDANPTINAIYEAINQITQLQQDQWEIMSQNAVFMWDEKYNLIDNYKSFAEHLKN